MVLPDPTGPYAIGTKYFHFVDNSREQGFKAETAEKREIVAQAWYPADPIPDAEPEPYWENANELSTIYTKRLSTLMEKVSIILNSKAMMKLPSFWFSHNSLTKTHSYPDAPISSNKLSSPVLIFSHGFFVCSNKLCTALMEELASHGYIVFSVAHAYDVPFFIYPDKTVKDFSAGNDLLAKMFVTTYDKRHIYLVEKLKETRNSSGQRGILKEINSEWPEWSQGTRIRVADVRFLIDELERMNSGGGIFAGKIDLNRLGVLGMSFGGSTAYGACLTDRRCKAGVSMDGFVAGSGMLEAGLTQPFMFMLSDNRHGMDDFFYNKAENTGYMLTIEGSEHLNFTDVSLVGGLQKLTGQLGSIDGKRCVRIINDYILSFFNKHLLEKDSQLLRGPSPDYPEVRFESRNSDK
jgi:predicted dienelactone hydrolase